MPEKEVTLEDLMRAEWVTRPSPPPDPAEIPSRRRAADAAAANLRLSGSTVPKAAHELIERWVRGEIDGDELIGLGVAQALRKARADSDLY